ncbi:VOC family protein [Cupriavidus taiwanensis]|uniref:Glyoxalase/bleomycin resistance protein/dioxygenase n=1 Tax=Cupriavidus taiwanensis (strain DSM 17343 / BCRC 17206 / CCUG 44338 / CIP 107171 / LMG 19424 / R1) TaxID=977880 RepID=B2AHR5_CUPTR|nr:VOC family protein [Cupriavidus taiwanensis]CAP63314.1 putative Glyoxalase/bleomycin resistance protein/dioxygenase [Cupriavidus taiwanensis LMG 19424]
MTQATTQATNIAAAPSVQLHGVHHTARPTWKLAETVHFYRDLLGLPLVHAISAKGWGPDNHADFLHFFFDSGNGSTIAFFYYIGTERPDWLTVREHYQDRATHTAWRVRDEAELLRWRQRVEAVGIPLRYQIRHEVIESIYFNDPNGYPIEITWQVRPFSESDAEDARLTIEAAIGLENAGKDGAPFGSIEPVWQRKAALIDKAAPAGKASVFVLDVPEFAALLDVADKTEGYATTPLGNGYVRIDGNPGIRFGRKALGFKPAVWYGALTGGLAGRIEQFDMDALVIAPGEAK